MHTRRFCNYIAVKEPDKGLLFLCSISSTRQGKYRNKLFVCLFQAERSIFSYLVAVTITSDRATNLEIFFMIALRWHLAVRVLLRATTAVTGDNMHPYPTVGFKPSLELLLTVQ
jgi:hypothetical protein